MRLRIIAALELALIFPAVLFMTALVLRTFGWLGLPFAVLLIGCATLYRDADLLHSARQSLSLLRGHMATLFVAVTTLAAVGILAIVILHMLAN